MWYVTPAMTGAELRQAISNPPPPKEFLVDDFLPERTVFMITGETGKGKSVIATQLGVSLSSATSLFGSLLISKPRRVFFIALEGDREDHFNRIHFMEQVCPLNENNFYWDQDPFFDVMNHSLVEAKLKLIASVWEQGPDIVIIDPIYKAVSLDLAKAEAAKALITFSDLLRYKFLCSVGFIHHVLKESYSIYGKKIEKEHGYYGHSFIGNHLHLAYLFLHFDEAGEKPYLSRRKSNMRKELESIRLFYRPETYTCSLIPDTATEFDGMNKSERIEHYLRSITQTNFYDVKQTCNVSDSFLREAQAKYVKAGLLQIIPSTKSTERHIWIPKFNPQVVSSG